MLEQNRFSPGPELVALLRRVASAKPAFLRACTDANLLRSHVGLHDGNRIYFLLEGIEAGSCAPWFGSYSVGSSLGRWFLSMMAC